MKFLLIAKKVLFLLALSELQLEDRISHLVRLGIPRSNIKIHPKCTTSCSSSLSAVRDEQFGFKVVGAFVGSSKFVETNLITKMPTFQHVADVLVKFPYEQGRGLLPVNKYGWYVFWKC